MTLVRAPVVFGPSGSALDPHAEAEILSDGRARGSQVRASARTVRRKKTQASREGNRNEEIENALAWREPLSNAWRPTPRDAQTGTFRLRRSGSGFFFTIMQRE